MLFPKSKRLPLALAVSLTFASSGCACCPNRHDCAAAGEAVGRVVLIVLIVALEIGLHGCGHGHCR